MSGEDGQTNDLQVANILLQESKYINYDFDFSYGYKDNNGSTIHNPIEVETFLNFYNELQKTIQGNLDSTTHITANQISKWADSIKDKYFNNYTSFTFPIKIYVSKQKTINGQNIEITTTNSYLEIIKDMFLNFITTTVTDPIYKQVFEVKHHQDLQQIVTQNPDFLEYIRGIANSDSIKEKAASKTLLDELIAKIEKIQQSGVLSQWRDEYM